MYEKKNEQLQTRGKISENKKCWVKKDHSKRLVVCVVVEPSSPTTPNLTPSATLPCFCHCRTKIPYHLNLAGTPLSAQSLEVKVAEAPND